jgi:hypothetical protein
MARYERKNGLSQGKGCAPRATKGLVMPDNEPAEVEQGTCHYPARCRVSACRAKATIVARAVPRCRLELGLYNPP